jgi:hypothetical protein
MSGAIPPLPQYAFTAWCLVKAQGQLYLFPYTFNFMYNFLIDFSLRGLRTLFQLQRIFSVECGGKDDG